ncbi:MAG: LysR family transcriptional regulator [Clostridia bacterium]|nr:LysR family transcriptional regulator [Clostridia bacterium]
MIDINFELYKIFYFTAHYMSFTKAADALFVTQSSISQSIKQLEEKMGVQLFKRNKKRIALTKEGEILFTHVEQAFHHIKTAERKIENYNIGEIHVGASDTICKYYLLPYLKDFHKNNPEIKINIVNQPSRRTLEMIQEGLMDFGIVAVSEDRNFEDIELSTWKTYDEVCIAGEYYFNLLGPTCQLEDLMECPMITLRENTNTRQFLDEAFQSRGLYLQPEFEMVSVDLIIEMVKADLGVGFAMEDTLKDLEVHKDLFQIKINPPLKSRKISFAVSQSQPLSEASKKFIDHVKKMVK